MILLDTSALIELFKGTEKGNKIKGILINEEVAITSITIHEFRILANKNELQIFNDFLNTSKTLPYDESSAIESSNLEKELITKGKTINRTDIFIAGIAKTNNLKVITLDKDFAKIDSLDAWVL